MSSCDMSVAINKFPHVVAATHGARACKKCVHRYLPLFVYCAQTANLKARLRSPSFQVVYIPLKSPVVWRDLLIISPSN
ncbi:hypothetical protein B5X24_HaOG205519 [Helicoverpa armigera]|nr:hypothetical protein B5X24_HaOG205519 [Helicoverpa armigera]